MPHIFEAAKKAGAHAAYLSGGGSTIAAFVSTDPALVAEAMKAEASARGYSGRALTAAPSEIGATIVTHN
jgi:homoserine kinase